ncbi:MAG: riboflavin kinase / FMN adenylyltransferase [Candidatus Tokpelaia sp. JSC161]|jgi:riboflavin kinase/FMN adenylyltransferase|nr:MAG: riboflavin kinase / FMN adenylyltransferase [Candidatus Tokpelaia sp. JSC161]
MKKTVLRLVHPFLIHKDLQGAFVAIGNFDGVHRGHQSVLQYTLDQAKKNRKPAIVLTFEPHPRTWFKPDSPVDRLTPPPEKATIFHFMGFDAVIEKSFTDTLAFCTAQSFVKDILRDSLAVSGVVTGNNFHFGYQRQGSPKFLKEAGEKLGFCVSIINSFQDLGEIISSSRIRTLLTQGSVQEAAQLLGYRYRVSETVIHGSALGRTLGFPTANMSLPSQTSLALGIYAVRFCCENGKIYDGVASFGCRPTVDVVSKPLLETYVFDFHEDIYGKTCSVSFFSFIRKEKKFPSLQALIAQMHQDEKKARILLAAVQPLSLLDHHLTFNTS